MPALRGALHLPAALLALAIVRFSAGSAGPPVVVRCEPCDAGALLRCRPLQEGACAERVREPGCGCCTTCALGEGRACGVYTGRCGSGLTCRHRPGESRPLQALLEGRGVCTGKASGGPATPPITPGGAAGVAEVGRGAPHNKLIGGQEPGRKAQGYKVETVSGGANTDVHNFSLESKRDAQYGPCRREMESVLNSLKISNALNPRGVHIPNCDKKGFYKKKQCRPSKGRKRGYCWCVDKYGQPLPPHDGKERGETQCNSQESI